MAPARIAAALAPLALAPAAYAFPSFRNKVPMGNKVPCPPGAEGCSEGSAALGEPESVCRGVGHTTCAGGVPTLNPFGEALRAAGFQWTTALCQADSDGDGHTNGQELGDPCCMWSTGAADSVYMASFSPSHPGFAASNQGAGYGAPECDASVAPAWSVAQMATFNLGEEQRHVDFIIKNYTIPAKRTTYVNFAFNFRDTGHPIYHIVFGEALVDQPRHLHHYVVTGCNGHIPDHLEGFPLEGDDVRDNPDVKGVNCNIPIGGFADWAPGSVLWDVPAYAGVPIGEGVGIVGFRINVHFTDGDIYPGSISQDGLRVHYTPDLRSDVIDISNPIFIGGNAGLVIPPGLSRWFITRTCEVVDVCEDVDDDLAIDMTNYTCKDVAVFCDVDIWFAELLHRYCPVTCGTTSRCFALQEAGGALPLVSVNFHGHLLGTEMYQTLTRGAVTHNLASAVPWHYQDQATTPLLSRNLSVRVGDVLQSTCVYHSDSRSEGTRFGPETVDEMCIISLGTLRSSATDTPFWPFGCRGNAWTGQLAPGESGLQVAIGHPESEATDVWQPRPGGFVEHGPVPALHLCERNGYAAQPWSCGTDGRKRRKPRLRPDGGGNPGGTGGQCCALRAESSCAVGTRIVHSDTACSWDLDEATQSVSWSLQYMCCSLAPSGPSPGPSGDQETDWRDPGSSSGPRAQTKRHPSSPKQQRWRR